ncbi:toprim domain-containing protein [Algoriphagus aquimarinus]|uniref:toprim domain-containing protein n=1 Tax=Algoriphagus aquimarinus TaxID=237018 RepID=UPI0030D86BCF|tara:strand:- start:240738 stop:241610 length:873 start_codon:yes stop_codon:yes gene_type:complete
MNCKQANQISIIEYLSQIGISPKSTKADCSFFLSPLRMEKTPSFKVDHNLNLWVDYGEGNSGGTLIDLVIKLNPTYSIQDALTHVGNLGIDSFSFHQQKDKISDHENSKIKVLSTKPIGTNQAITDYLISREIQPEIAEKYCKEVYYSVDGKRYFGVGNENSNGWSIRNKYWKGCTGQGSSVYFNNREFSNLAVFEGIFDLMSFIQMDQFNLKLSGFVVLNSLVNIKELKDFYQLYDNVNLFLDHDEAGKTLTVDLLKSNHNFTDQSSLYSPFKDLNEMLVNENTHRYSR